MLLQAEYDLLTTSFSSISSLLPEQPLGSKLPPIIDVQFAQEEGAWPVFNKAMHSSFGHRDTGIKIEEHGFGLTETLKVIQWCLKALEQMKDKKSVSLVKSWMEDLKRWQIRR
ncbi:hypothetical protein Clacol_010427 [Clathrus columnatus]|uniref:Uncharacterized protein n=1 Tax=Clathrus columnatus TaxID=1419009 RepID=A0AAV5AQP8_9AGAM|nr:hypothetical protein Clacol_010427 [Clathrus columnatus]